MIVQGDCLEEMRKMPDNTIDFIVTDPPYGLHFMGKQWDDTVPNKDIWNEAWRICKPGSMLAAFGSPRTHHLLMSALEQVGWEIRDCIMWLYGSGFPKSHNKFGLKGYGTALKPAWEPIIICMKPLEGTYAQNVEKWGLGGINIDDSRINIDSNDDIFCKNPHTENKGENQVYGKHLGSSYEIPKGRWPANLILDEEAAEILDRHSGVLKTGSGNRRPNGGGQMFSGFSPIEANFDSSSGGASRFFYCAKASSKERNAGIEGMELKNSKRQGDRGPSANQRPNAHNGVMESNNHPTVKPLSLMRYILKLLAPPNNPIVLDPFAGSGSTLCAAKQLGIRHIGIELQKDYCDIAQKRLDHIKEFEEK